MKLKRKRITTAEKVGKNISTLTVARSTNISSTHAERNKRRSHIARSSPSLVILMASFSISEGMTVSIFS